MDSQKQQAAERIKQANNILVTVSNNPSVDQLAACIGLTLTLNKMGKHATAVFSGHTPSTIEFLQPEKTLETNTDSLRDFIIALDKSKADKLRYKVEDRVVKIFITPYRTSINEKDLEFSQGDFNVDVVLALGVHNQADLDQAITSHGRILHDATVVTMNIKPGGELGSINWLEPNSSSLSELGTQLIDALDKKLIDGQIATAMLTGIVAETERFSNSKTTPLTMSISAELMGAGANQQLVATKLEEPEPVPVPRPEPIASQDGQKPTEEEKQPEAKKTDDGTLEITHDDKASNQPAPEETHQEEGPKPEEAHEEPESRPEEPAHEEPKEEYKPEEPAPTTVPPEPTPQPEPITPPQINIDEHGALSPFEDMLPPRAPSEPPAIIRHSESPKMVLEPPTLGGQLTASAEPGHGEAVEGGTMPERALLTATPPMGQTIMPPENESDEESPSGGAARGDSFLVGSGEPTAPSTPVIVPPMPEMPQMVVTPDAPAPDSQGLPLGAGRTLSDIEQDVHSTHIDAPQLPAADLVQPTTQSQTGPMLPPLPSNDVPAAPAPANDASLPVFDINSLPASDASPVADADKTASGAAGDVGAPTLSSARDAVTQALGSSTSLDPIQSLNANPVDLPMGNPNDAAPQAPPEPWTPPPPTIVEPAPAAPAPDPNQPAATLPQFDPAMFGAQENDGNDPNSPPPVPPPMMPPTNPY